MKKTFISLFLLTLLTVFGSLSVKADEVLSFVYTQKGYDPGSGIKKYCNGSDADKDKWIADGDFNWNQTIDYVAQQEVSSEKWTGVDQAYACTRSDVSFSAANYTLTLLTYRTNHPANMTLPSISINGDDIYASEARWGVSSTETIVSNQFNYTNDNGKGAFQTEVRLIYHIKIDVANSYGISVSFPSGYDRFKDYVKTLTISQDAPAAPTYEVSATASNGTVSGTGSFAEGASVTLTASPNEDYSFSSWSTSDVNISGHENENPLTFTMPNKAVSITANFTACTKHMVTLAANNNEYGSVSGGGLQCDGSVTVNASPNSDYRFVNWTNTTSEVVSTNAEYTFPLSADISLTANFEVNPCTNTKTIQCENTYLTTSTGITVIDGNEAHATPSEIRTASSITTYNGTGYVTLKDASGNGHTGDIFFAFTLSEEADCDITIRYASANANSYANIFKKVDALTGDISYNGKYYDKISYHRIGGEGNWNWPNNFTDWKFTEEDLDATDYILVICDYSDGKISLDQITFTASENIFCPNTITMEKSGDESAAAPSSSPSNAAMAGTVVTVTAGEASANHYFSGWTVLPENAVTFDAPASPTTTFVMPEADVTITANYGAVVSSALTFSAVEGGSIVSATAGGEDISSGEAVVSGTSVTLTAGANSNYVFINWTDDNNSDAVVSTNAAFTFSMPATATAYTANFAQIDNVISQGSETGSSTYNSGASMEESHMDDFGTFGHSVLKLSYSNMTGGNYYGWNIGKKGSYSSTNSAGATGFGFYYKTETDADKVAFCFDYGSQYKIELPATDNVWKYHYIATDAANGWNGTNIIIYLNGKDGDNTTAHASGAIYIADIAATSIISKPEINTYIYTRTNASNSYGTLCLPMAGSVSGATLYSVAGKQEEGGKLYIVLEEQGTTLAAGEPYIFETDGSTLTATMSGPHRAVNADANGLVGTYQQITAPAYSEPDDLNYVLALDNSGNTVFKKVGENVTVGAYRAYINIKNAGDYSPASAAPGRKYIRFGIEGTEEEQAVEMIYDDASLRTRKIMQNGHLYILRDGHLFTAQGTQIK